MSTERLAEIQSPTPPYAVEIAADGDGRPQVVPSRSYIHHDHHHHEHRVPTNVVPVPLLARYPALAECPGCRNTAPTYVSYKAGKGTQ